MSDHKTQWLDMQYAPRDGSIIWAILENDDECEIQWSEQRTCMMAGYAGGSGYFGPGWQDAENKLICFEEPVGWMNKRA